MVGPFQAQGALNRTRRSVWEWDVDFCKMDIGPALGRKNLVPRFSFLSLNYCPDKGPRRFFKEIEE
jgi:hypothetical protein